MKSEVHALQVCMHHVPCKYRSTQAALLVAACACGGHQLRKLPLPLAALGTTREALAQSGHRVGYQQMQHFLPLPLPARYATLL